MGLMDTITIGLMGDVMIGRLVNEFLDGAPPHAIWGDLLEELHATDLNLINLEAALTKSERRVPKVFNFKADPKKVDCLIEGRIDIVNLANNHVLDFATEGLLETVATLDKAHILHVGAGKTLQEARKPAIVNCRGIRIGVLGYTDNEPDWNATETRPGVRYLEVGDLETALSDLRPLREAVDILIFSYHWGPNMRSTPPREFVHFAHQLIDHGVDIFHGHSAHVFQGIEEYKKGLILYDTGDFIDDYAVDPLLRNDHSFLFLVEVSKEGYRAFRLIPTVIRNFCAHRAKGREAEHIQERMRELSMQITAVPEKRP
jgi:poly-gamma-glutamate capsule biosynthesis protein CapA/YwtB (metallophosphatase superfamily)